MPPAWRRRPDVDGGRGGVALLLTTLRLGGARRESAALRQAWETRADYPGLAGLIDFEGCALWLARRLRQIGADTALASDLGGFVTRCARDIAASNLLVDAETETMLGFLTARGTPCILLKGAARRALAHQLPFADARATMDLDLLVPGPAARGLWDDLRAPPRGYALGFPDRNPRPRHHHLPALVGPGGVSVEIHTSVAPGIPAELTWQRLRSTATTIQRFGVETLVPSTTELLWDGMMHAVRSGARGFRLHQLLAASCIVATGGGAELREVRDRLARRSSAPPSLAGAWLDAATWLGGAGDGDPPAILTRSLQWRLAVARRLPASHRVLGVWADEASRLEFDLPPSRGVTGGLRPLGATLVRNAYRFWRLARAS